MYRPHDPAFFPRFGGSIVAGGAGFGKLIAGIAGQRDRDGRTYLGENIFSIFPQLLNENYLGRICTTPVI
jgi:hypothetical protein